MLIEPLLLLTLRKLRANVSFRLSTLALFLQPILWLSIFLFLREANISIELRNGTIRYIDFLVVGIFMWRTVSFIMGKLPKEILVEGPVLRSIVTSSSGAKILLWSSILSTTTVAALMGFFILVTGAIVYGFSPIFDNIILASFALFLVFVIHIGIAVIFVSFSYRFHDIRHIEFMIVTVFGLLSGVFFPVELYPSPINDIAYALPLTQGLTLIRELTLLSINEPQLNLLYTLVVEATILFGGGLILYGRNIQHQTWMPH